jgi:hypothetical protein
MGQRGTVAGILPHVLLWLADATQNSTLSWLTSPTVVILGFIAAVIAILQGIISAVKWFIGQTNKSSTRRRLIIFAALCTVISVAILAPITWSSITAIDAKMDPKWLADLYPIIIFVPALLCALLLLNFDFKSKVRITIELYVGMIACLALPTIIYDTAVKSTQEQYLVSAVPGVTIMVLAMTALSQLWPRTKIASEKPAQAKDSKA